MPVALRNPKSPFRADEIEWDGEPPAAELEVYEEEASSIVARNESPDVGFEFSVNPYRGCYHGCAYCYARPTHQYLDLGAGTDFDRKLVAKINAPELLRAAFEKPSWRGDLLAFSGVTDCYQPLEAGYRLTRRCLEVCLAYKNPVSVVTKGSVIRRDAELLAALARDAGCGVTISVTFADDETARLIEPWAPPISRRLETMRVLADAGVPVGVIVAPIIPGVNDAMIPTSLERARDAGAAWAGRVLLRLPREVLPVFDERLEAALPGRAEKVRSAIRQMRRGKNNESELGLRMRGDGPRWEVVEQLFDTTCARLGLDRPEGLVWKSGPTRFERPRAQLSLF